GGLRAQPQTFFATLVLGSVACRRIEFRRVVSSVRRQECVEYVSPGPRLQGRRLRQAVAGSRGQRTSQRIAETAGCRRRELFRAAVRQTAGTLSRRHGVSVD